MLCVCEEWEFRDIAVATSVAAIERTCPRCRRRVLLVFRAAEHVGTVELEGAHTARLEQSLRSLRGLAEAEVELLLTVARLMAVAGA